MTQNLHQNFSLFYRRYLFVWTTRGAKATSTFLVSCEFWPPLTSLRNIRSTEGSVPVMRCSLKLLFFFLLPLLQTLSGKSTVSSRSISHTVSSPPVPSDELSPTTGGIGGFPVFGGAYPSALSHLEEGGFEQEEGKAEVTCMWAGNPTEDTDVKKCFPRRWT